MLIRLACPTDAEALVRLNGAFTGVDDVSAADVRRSLETAREIVAVAVVDDAVIAFCCAQVHHSFCYAAPAAEITEMYVDKIFRRQGCAQAMLGFLEGHLRDSCGVDEIHLLTSTANHAAQSV